MKLYDNDAYREEFMALVYDLLHSDGTNDRANQIIDAFDMAPAVEAEPLPPNAPLTLEEMREMDLFEWLWIEVVCPSRMQVFRKIESAYYQVFEDYTDGDALCCGWPGLIHEFEYEDYGKTWLAYRRRPEKETQNG